MIKGDELRGKPVLRRDGQQLDVVRDVVADQRGHRLLAITIEHADGEPRAIPFGGIERIGPDAVLVSAGVEGMPIRHWPEVSVVLEQRQPYKGRSVMTTDGQQFGRLVDLCFDENTGEIMALEVSRGTLSDLSAGRSLIPASGCTFGEVVIVESGTLEQTEQRGGLGGGLKQALSKAGEVVQGAAARVAGTVTGAVSGTIDMARQRLEDNQKRFVVGRTTTNDVTDADGNLIVAAGTEITTEDAERASASGVLRALFLSAGGKALREALERARTTASDAIGHLRGEVDVPDGSGLEPGPALEATLGYTASRAVNGADGSPIVQEGEVVTEEAIKRAARERFESDLVNAVFGELNPSPSFDTVQDDPKADPAPLTLDTEGNPNVTAEEESVLRRLVGQPVQRAVLGADGRAIVQPGEVLTTEALERARTEGLMPELTAALQDGPSDTVGGEAQGAPPDGVAPAMAHLGAMDGQADRSQPATDNSSPNKLSR